MAFLLFIGVIWWGFNKLSNYFNNLGKGNLQIQEKIDPPEELNNINPSLNPEIEVKPSNAVPVEVSPEQVQANPSPSQEEPPRAYEPTYEDLNQPSNEILPDSHLNPLSHVPGNTLVSCQTKVQFCQPDSGNYTPEEANNGTFCITYAANCDDTNTIQRTWTEEEVFNVQPVETPPVPHNEEPMYPNGQEIPGSPPNYIPQENPEYNDY